MMIKGHSNDVITLSSSLRHKFENRFTTYFRSFLLSTRKVIFKLERSHDLKFVCLRRLQYVVLAKNFTVHETIGKTTSRRVTVFCSPFHWFFQYIFDPASHVLLDIFVVFGINLIKKKRSEKRFIPSIYDLLISLHSTHSREVCWVISGAVSVKSIGFLLVPPFSKISVAKISFNRKMTQLAWSLSVQ